MGPPTPTLPQTGGGDCRNEHGAVRYSAFQYGPHRKAGLPVGFPLGVRAVPGGVGSHDQVRVAGRRVLGRGRLDRKDVEGGGGELRAASNASRSTSVPRATLTR